MQYFYLSTEIFLNRHSCHLDRVDCQGDRNDLLGGIVVRILHYVHQVRDGCFFVAIRSFGEKAAWVHQAHDTEQLNMFYMMTHFELFDT